MRNVDKRAKSIIGAKDKLDSHCCTATRHRSGIKKSLHLPEFLGRIAGGEGNRHTPP